MEKNDLRRGDLRSSYSEQLQEILREHYPRIMKRKESRNFNKLRELSQYFSSGIPFDYLEADWEDYQVADRSPLQRVRDFAASIPFQAHTGGGLVLIGKNGVGKSFFSYMCAIESIHQWRLQTFCFSVREYLDKKSYQFHNPLLFEEMLSRIEQARVVILDNLSRESDKIGWKPEDLFEIIDRVTGDKRKRCVILNTNMSQEDYKAQGSSTFSRTRNYEQIPIDHEDFRSHRPDYKKLIEIRKSEKRKPKCYKPLSFLEDKSGRNTPEACYYCAYSTRAELCWRRVKHKWIPLETKE